MVFIDACFSGGARNEGLLSARGGFKIKPKSQALNGNIVVLTASSNIQSALPLKDKYHGIFTYYLLKKIQESNGNINFKDLFEFVKNNVYTKSLIVNSKEQTPDVLFSNEVKDTWSSWTLIDQ